MPIEQAVRAAYEWYVANGYLPPVKRPRLQRERRREA